MGAPAAYQPLEQETGLTRQGMAAVLLSTLKSNAFLHREIVRKGRYEFLVHSVRSDIHGLTRDDYGWVFDQLLATKPPEIAELPNGTILDDRGNVVAPTRDDLRNAEAMALTVAEAPRRVFLG
jgi:hypothetical protein